MGAILLIGSPRSKYSVSEYFILRQMHNFQDLNNLQACQNFQCLNILFCVKRIIFKIRIICEISFDIFASSFWSLNLKMADDDSLQDSQRGVPGNIRILREDATVATAALVASQGSVAVFQQRARRTLLEIEQDEVVVRKGNLGLPGLKIYVANRIAATQTLSSEFLGSFHLQSKNAAGKNVQMSKHLQDEFVSNLKVMKKFKECVYQYDMRTLLQVPAIYCDIVGEDAWDARWDASNPHCEIVDLTCHWGKLPLDHILKWQRDFNGYSSEVDHVSSI